MAAKAKKQAKPQSERFIEAARKAGVDESGRTFRQAMGKILRAKNVRKPSRTG